MIPELMIEIKVLLLLIIANGMPIIMQKIMRNKWQFPIDAGILFYDKQPLFGSTKTVRGFVASIIVTSFAAPLFGMEIVQGGVFALWAMAGDLLSSFIKRRLKMKPSSMALGLDQIPESLLPLLALQDYLQITLIDVVNIVLLFLVCELALSRLLYHLRIRDRPY